MSTKFLSFNSKSLPYHAILNLMPLNLLLLTVYACCAPCSAQGEIIDLFKAAGVNKLREHVIKVPSMQVIVEKDTSINEPVYFQKVLDTQFLRGYLLKVD